ncbi:MAG: META domain-containing protein [Anaerolineales bacterium]|nr:META domain-containing protein [Anaerolineales bacterium]
MRPFTLFLFAVLLMAACGAPAAPGEPQSELAGTSWVLTSLNGNTQVGEAIGSQPVTISFEADGRVSGFSGCNGFGGDYEADARDGSLSFSPLVSTLIACEEPIMSVEQAFFAALQNAGGYAISGNTLTISSNGDTLEFARE